MTDLLILFGLGLLTALACGLGAIPVFALGERVGQLRPLLWGLDARVACGPAPAGAR
jgi:hypothetical protein